MPLRRTRVLGGLRSLTERGVGLASFVRVFRAELGGTPSRLVLGAR